jgi:outer membrane receptor protein involved in Fe transport
MPIRFLSLFLLAAASVAADPSAQSGAAPPSSSAPGQTPQPSVGQPVVLDPFVVTAQLDQARDSILPNLGATSFLIDQDQLQDQPQGGDESLNQTLLRAPVVAEDSAANGDLHVRGEHANLQYRINGVLLPEGITGFGLELDPRFVSSMQLITGSLPAQYGFRTAGVVDIQTKSGVAEPGGDMSVYGGSFDTVRPSFEVGGSEGVISYFADGSYDHNDLGIENPTSSATPIHDATEQSKAFATVSDILSSTSRLNFMASASSSNFQVPDTPGLPAGTSPDGNPWLPGAFNSAGLNENQNEQNYYAVATYQKSAGGLDFQLSAFGRNSSVHFTPDPAGDLYFNGVASDVDRNLSSGGLQGDGSHALGAGHTLRAGFTLLDESVDADSTTTVFPVDADGDPTGSAHPISNDSTLHGLFAGAYAQDEWKIGSRLTVNGGARFDGYDASFDDENQFSPRINAILQATDTTTIHAGYSRYFTPPPVENIPAGTVAEFNGTSNASATDQDDPVKAERSNYYDAGISQMLAPGLYAGVDCYYKQAKNQLDDGLFGQTLILSAFNYAKGQVDGQELTASYSHRGFSTYANLAHSVAKGEDWSSAQFLFDPSELAYVQDHWIYLDHDQSLTGSFGAAYLWSEAGGSTRLYADVLHGSGLRADATAPDGTTIPNGTNVPAYTTLNLGAERIFRAGAGHSLKLRLDVINLTDESYELRNGSGVGVNAPQYGMRRGFYGDISWLF